MRLEVLITLFSVLPISLAAADTVSYEVIFDASWSRQTHPVSFPPNPHFSGLIGGTHNSDVSFWELGGLATSGIEQMAETGSKFALQSEVNAAISAGTADVLLSGGGVGLSPGTRRLSFSIDSEYPLVSLVSMIAPSPDWFVGVSGLSLLDEHWQPEIVVPLLPYDAGTDSGPNYTSGNSNTNPQEPIFVLEDGSFLDTPALGTFTFRLTTGDFDNSGSHTAADLEQLTAAINSQQFDATFDLDADGDLDLADQLYWVERLYGSRVGDANLDRVVDVRDFNRWNDNQGAPATWATGDFNGDNIADATDFELLQANLFTPAESVAASVPEPSAVRLTLIAGALFMLRKRRKQVI